MPLSVRPATAADAAPLGRALESLELFTAYKLDARKLEERFLSALQRHEGLVAAELDGELVGVCWFIARGAFGTGAYLRTLAVKNGLQGKGIGKALLDAYEAGSGAPPGGFFLLASDFNEGAHRFYGRYGYKEIGKLPDFAARGVTERVFWKPRSETGSA